MKNKVIAKILALILIISTLFSFTGCDVLYEFMPEICPHSWVEEYKESATCEKEGFAVYFCEYCGSEKEETLHVLEHNFNTEWKYDGEKHWKKCATCDDRKNEEAHDFSQCEDDAPQVCYFCSYEKIEVKGAISFHFMMLGNENTGDAIYVKAGENDILIDAGSRANSIDDIKTYIDNYVTDNKLEFVIATHADQDHIDGFAKTDGSIFDLYECETIIDFAKSNKTTQTYQRYLTERQAEVDAGAKHYTALECYNNQNGAKRTYELTEDGNVKMEILYNYFYDHDSSDENNFSVCIMFHHGSRQFLFTGDLEKEGEEKLAEFYDFTQVELFKAGHHGSYTSSNECLLSEIKPKMSVVCCCAGAIERKTRPENLFPSQNFINRMAKYTSAIYASTAMDYVVPDGAETVGTSDNVGDLITLNGNIQVISDAEKGVFVECSNNNLKLKETEWFKKYRTWPTNGVA